MRESKSSCSSSLASRAFNRLSALRRFDLMSWRFAMKLLPSIQKSPPLAKAGSRRSRPLEAVFLVALLSLLPAGCSALHRCGAAHQQPQFVGWLLHGATTVSPQRPNTSHPPDLAVLTRSEETNALSLAFSPGKHSKIRSSLDRDQYKILLYFQLPGLTASDVQDVRVPIVHSKHLTISGRWLLPTSSQIAIELTADRLGADLLAATLMSPIGLRGVIQISQPPYVISLDGRAARGDFGYATIWLARQGPNHHCLVIRSEVEYPVHLFTLTTSHTNPIHIQIHKTLHPLHTVIVPLNQLLDPPTLQAARLVSGFPRQVPAHFWQRYR